MVSGGSGGFLQSHNNAGRLEIHSFFLGGNMAIFFVSPFKYFLFIDLGLGRNGTMQGPMIGECQIRDL